MFQERQDVFEFPQEKIDWKYPQQVKVKKSKTHKLQEIQHYNEMNVTKQNPHVQEVDEDELYYQQSQKLLKSKLGDEITAAPKSALVKVIQQFRSTFGTMITLFVALMYMLHFNFASSMLRFIYMIFVAMFPLVSILTNWVIGNNMKRVVLED